MKPWLWIPASLSYKVAPLFLKLHGTFYSPKCYSWNSLNWKGLHFANRLGIAGGVDKNAEHVFDWWTYGAGFIETGTHTPRPQDPNPGKIVDRSNAALAVWNKMGFPNKGVDFAKTQLEQLQRPYHTPLFANVGKNRDTPNESAHQDYLICMEKLADFVDAFVINISSPNTQGLRELLKPDRLTHFLKPIAEANRSWNKPLLLKLSPDQTESELENTLNTSDQLGFDGWILTNTTTDRPSEVTFPKAGGLSGAPLAKRSKQLLKQTVEILGDRKSSKLVISSGGVLSPQDVFERIQLGADLVQVYAALIFEGPSFFRKVAKHA